MSSDQRFRIDRIGAGERREEWRRALGAFLPEETLKKEGAAWVYRGRMLGREVVVKVRELRSLADRLKVALGAGRGRRHWRGASWLLEHGFATARPLVLAMERGSAAREWLVMEALPGASLLRHIADADLGVREQHGLARAVGRQVAALCAAGRFNRDHKPSNLIVSRRGGEFVVSIIDCVAIRRGRDGAVRMLHALAVEPTGLRILPRRAVLARVIAAVVEAEYGGRDRREAKSAMRGARRAYWGLVMESLRRHGDATPRTNPLAPGPSALR
ncbi:MAG: hypothetical protein KF678_03100 [Phycisphaeraceae bacterium]|nr:hypothetical protein [Phycisphaeraceae bacterium]